VFIQKWVTTTELSLSSKNESPVTRKEKAMLYDYLIALNEDMSSLDDLSPPAPTEYASSSGIKKQELPENPSDSPESLDL
jgi:hypothetical protein